MYEHDGTSTESVRRGDRRCRRLRGRRRMAARVLGRRGVAVHDPRNAVQHGRRAQGDVRGGRAAHGRSARAARGRGRRARAAVRRRDRHAHRRDPVRHRRQRCGRAVLRRGRGSVAQALRIWGKLIAEQPGRSRTRSSTRRRRHVHPVGIPARARRSLAELAPCSISTRPRSRARSRRTTRRSGPAATFELGTLDECRPTGSSRRNRTGRSRSTRRRFTATAASRRDVHLLRRRSRCDARVIDDERRGFDNLFAAGECMAGNILSRGYLAGFGLTIGSVFGRIAGNEAAAMLA